MPISPDPMVWLRVHGLQSLSQQAAEMWRQRPREEIG